MSPTAAIVTTPAGTSRGVVFADRRRRRLAAARGFAGAAFAFSATGAGVPSTSSEKTNADRDDHGARSEDKCERPHGPASCGCRGR